MMKGNPLITNLNELWLCWRLWPGETENIYQTLLYSSCLWGLFLSHEDLQESRVLSFDTLKDVVKAIFTPHHFWHPFFELWNSMFHSHFQQLPRSPFRSLPAFSPEIYTPKVLGSVQSQDLPFPRDRRWPRPRKAGPPQWPSHLHCHAWHRHNSSGSRRELIWLHWRWRCCWCLS